MREVCDDGIDNDEDGAIDCAVKIACKTRAALKTAPMASVTISMVPSTAPMKTVMANAETTPMDATMMAMVPLTAPMKTVMASAEDTDGRDNDGDGVSDCDDIDCEPECTKTAPI